MYNYIDKEAAKLLKFWFSNKDKWFVKEPEFDNLLKSNFELLYNQAIEGKLDSWTETPDELLALILIFDQLPRNIYRNTPKAFETDHEAVSLCKHAIKYKLDYKIANKEKLLFLYMPLQHSENLDDQQLSIKKYANISKEALNFAKLHMDIIEKFGRFPHRNTILGRITTKEEAIFLTQKNSSF